MKYLEHPGDFDRKAEEGDWYTSVLGDEWEIRNGVWEPRGRERTPEESITPPPMCLVPEWLPMQFKKHGK